MGLDRYTSQINSGKLLGGREGLGLVFESADFFMDQTYFSVCSYVIIKDM